MSVAVGIFVNGNFAGERAVDIGEIACGQDHAEDPPDEADLQAIVAGLGVGDGERVQRIAGGEHQGINAEDHAGQHAGQISARSKEGFVLIALAQFKKYTCQSSYGEQREDQAPGPVGEVVQDLTLHAEG